MLLKVVIGLVLLLIIGKSVAGIVQKKSLSKIPFLEHSAVQEYEIVRISGYHAGAVHYIKTSNTFIIPTSHLFESWINLWRINADGLVIDSFTPDEKYEGNLPASGIFFRKENYIDWVFTGDKLPKPYIKVLDARTLNKKQITELLAQSSQIVWADEIYYEQIYHGSKQINEFHYFLKSLKGWSILISPEKLTTEEFPVLDSALGEGFPSDYHGPDLGLSTINPDAFNVANPESPLRLIFFKKQGKSTSGWKDLNSHAWEGYYGYGHFQLNIDNEIINFKSFHRVLKHRLTDAGRKVRSLSPFYYPRRKPCVTSIYVNRQRSG